MCGVAAGAAAEADPPCPAQDASSAYRRPEAGPATAVITASGSVRCCRLLPLAIAIRGVGGASAGFVSRTARHGGVSGSHPWAVSAVSLARRPATNHPRVPFPDAGPHSLLDLTSGNLLSTLSLASPRTSCTTRLLDRLALRPCPLADCLSSCCSLVTAARYTTLAFFFFCSRCLLPASLSLSSPWQRVTVDGRTQVLSSLCKLQLQLHRYLHCRYFASPPYCQLFPLDWIAPRLSIFTSLPTLQRTVDRLPLCT